MLPPAGVTLITGHCLKTPPLIVIKARTRALPEMRPYAQSSVADVPKRWAQAFSVGRSGQAPRGGQIEMSAVAVIIARARASAMHGSVALATVMRSPV